MVIELFRHVFLSMILVQKVMKLLSVHNRESFLNTDSRFFLFHICAIYSWTDTQSSALNDCIHYYTEHGT